MLTSGNVQLIHSRLNKSPDVPGPKIPYYKGEATKQSGTNV